MKKVKNNNIPTNLELSTGDILASRSNEFNSKVIQVGTNNEWSHVGIVMPSGEILEAAKKTDKNKRRKQVRPLPYTDFISDSDNILHIKRLIKSSDSDDFLNQFQSEVEGKKYTTLHALATAFPEIVYIIYCGIFPVLFIWMNFESISIVSVISMFLILFLIAKCTVASSRITLGVKQTEKYFNKYKHLKKLVDLKNQMFCSKLVLQADTVLGGPISSKIKNEQEVQPKDIVNACSELTEYFELTRY